MKRLLPLAVAAALLASCGGSEPNSATSPPAAESPAAAVPSAPAPEIGILTLEELDLRGCGMALYPPGSNPNNTGIYLFSGLVGDTPAEDGSMRMKIDGEVVKFRRTETGGEAIPGGQFASQTFVSEDGSTTVTVDVAGVRAGAEPEFNPLTEATISLNRSGQETAVEAAGDAGC